MTLDQFVAISKLETLTELDKSCQLAYYYMRTSSTNDFSASDCLNWLEGLGFGKPNKTRLEQHLAASRDTVKGAKAGLFRLHHTYVKKLGALYPQIAETSQEVIDRGAVLPEVLYRNSRGYLESLAKQINASYENNIFDGCAVLMRRLEEVLLIHAYEKHGIASVIKDGNDNYLLLEGIVKDAVGNATLSLSRNSKVTVEDIRKLGNFSAHKITYTCKREYISEKIPEFRALIDELLHKAGIRS
jgi:hypothetical protein